MKVLYLLLVFLLFVIVFNDACITTKCPEDVKIGEIALSEKSLEFFPFEANPKLIFKDNIGNELVFISKEGVKLESTKIAIYKKCTEFKYDGQSSYEYFTGKSKNIVLFSQPEAYAYNLGLYTTNLRPEKELFYDKLIVDINETGTIGRGEIVTDIRFTEQYSESDFGIDSPMTFIDSIVLNSIVYKDIYASKLIDGKQIYYNKDKGIIGFIKDNKIFNLDRIE